MAKVDVSVSEWEQKTYIENGTSQQIVSKQTTQNLSRE